jgi:prepilin-type N-terminal cleavage/methylation domain-containing protein
MSSGAHRSCERGFTLVEVMVAIVILLVGVLGVVAMIDGANAVTSKTKAREGATNIARSVIEVSRSVRYRDLTTDELLAALSTRPGLADASPAPGYTIRQRGLSYRMTLTVCSLDDPKDELGTMPGVVLICPDSDRLPAGQPSRDRNPDDYKRVRVTLDWISRGADASVTQTSSIINPVGGLGPSVAGLAMTFPTSTSNDQVRIESDVDHASFAATTSSSAAEVDWSVGGDVQGKAERGPINWTFDWDLDRPDGSIAYHDCTYVIQADAFDNQGRAGAPRALTVILNRRAPLSVEDFDGGRNENGNRVDLQWNSTPECDVEGYEVYRSTGTDPATATQVDCIDRDLPDYTTKTTCLDDPPGAATYTYWVRALDKLADASLREGDVSPPITVGGANTVPEAPTNLRSCIGGELSCHGPDGEAAPTGVVVVGWDQPADPDGNIAFYRIYRDGIAYENRHGVFYPGGGEIAWFEHAPDGQAHTYYVTAVDDDFGESMPSAGISAGPGG